MQDLDPVEDESRVDVRGSSGPDATGVGGDEAELPPAIGDGDGERPVVEGEEIAVANEEGEIERDVNGDRGAGVGDSDAVEIESNDLEVGIGGPEEEDGEGEEGDGEEEVGDAPTDAREGGGSVVGREEDVVDGGFVVVVVVVVVLGVGRGGRVWLLGCGCFYPHLPSLSREQELSPNSEEEKLNEILVQKGPSPEGRLKMLRLREIREGPTIKK